MTTADEIIAKLNLQPHPEGGRYRQTWLANAEDGQRPTGSCIYYMLQRDEVSRWHRIDAVEVWHYYAGAPLTLRLKDTLDGAVTEVMLGPNILSGERPQVIVPKHVWQSATSDGDWTLVGCTVSPSFHFDGLEFDDGPVG